MKLGLNYKNWLVSASCIGVMAAGLALCGFTDNEVAQEQFDPSLPRVWFTAQVTPDNLRIITNSAANDLPSHTLKGNVAVKVHTGEAGNQNYLRPELFKDVVNEVSGTVVECNTAYAGQRDTTEKHQKLIEDHGWNKYYHVDILDFEGPDMALPVLFGKVLKVNYVGRNLSLYDSMLVISHFKGHAMGGYGGALKQISIGCASAHGKAWIHSAGRTTEPNEVWSDLPEKDKFQEAMADAASSVMHHFRDQMVFVNVMTNMSVDCDCAAKAEDPCLQDIGALASTDPVALDRACLDLIYKSHDKGREHFLERVHSRNGEHVIEAAYDLGLGNVKYTLVNTDEAKG